MSPIPGLWWHPCREGLNPSLWSSQGFKEPMNGPQVTETVVSHPRHAARPGQMDANGHSMKKGMEERLENFEVQK